MIWYVYCTCRSSEKILAKKIREAGIEIRKTRGNSIYRKESKEYGTALPFFAHEGKVVSNEEVSSTYNIR